MLSCILSYRKQSQNFKIYVANINKQSPITLLVVRICTKSMEENLALMREMPRMESTSNIPRDMII